MKPRRYASVEMIAEYIRMHHQGKSVAEIKSVLNISSNVASKIKRSIWKIFPNQMGGDDKLPMTRLPQFNLSKIDEVAKEAYIVYKDSRMKYEPPAMTKVIEPTIRKKLVVDKLRQQAKEKYPTIEDIRRVIREELNRAIREEGYAE